jgi:CheY-like chemotaxis protein
MTTTSFTPENAARLYVHADDDADEVELFREAFEQVRPDARLVSLRSGPELCAFLDTLHPILVFLDLDMPGMDGFDCLAAIRRQPQFANLPLVVYSGMSDANVIGRTYDAGADLFFIKPFTFPALAAAISGILDLDWETPGAVHTRFCHDGRVQPFNVELPGDQLT